MILSCGRIGSVDTAPVLLPVTGTVPAGREPAACSATGGVQCAVGGWHLKLQLQPEQLPQVLSGGAANS
jgi:hypothetical protein